MPELPEVHEFDLLATNFMVSHHVQDINFIDTAVIKYCQPEDLLKNVKGNLIRSTRQHGKFLFLILDHRGSIVLHFGMTGRLKRGTPADQAPPHTKLIFHLQDNTQIFYTSMRKLGFVSYTNNVDLFIQQRNLGPHVLDIDADTFLDRWSHYKSPVKALLLNQRFVAGVGNLYADEALFQAKAHPLQYSHTLEPEQVRNIYTSLLDILKKSIEKHTLFPLLPKQYLLHDRKGRKDCPRCGHALDQIKAGGRTSIYCPHCQMLTGDTV